MRQRRRRDRLALVLRQVRRELRAERADFLPPFVAVRQPAPARLLVLAELLLGESLNLMVEYGRHLDAPLLERGLDRVEDESILVIGDDEQHELARFEEAERCAAADLA